MKLKLESLFLNSSRPPTSVKLNLITACYPESHLMYSNGGSKMLMKCCLNVNDDFRTLMYHSSMFLSMSLDCDIFNFNVFLNVVIHSVDFIIIKIIRKCTGTSPGEH